MNVLLLPETATASAVVDRLVEWSAGRLLAPFCVWPVGDVEGGEVRHVAAGRCEPRLLGDALAASDPAAIAFSAFHPAKAGEGFDERFAAAVAACLDTAVRVLDFDPDKPLACTMVVAPGDVGQPVPPELFRASWPGIYVAPEDRARPGAVNQLDRSDGRFVRHAAHAAATIAGIWSTPAANRPDLLAHVAAEPAGPLAVGVRVARCFSRSVELGYLPDHVAALAFSAAGGWPRPDPERFDRSPDPARVVAHLSAGYLAKHRDTLGRRPFKEVTEDEPKPLGLVAAFRELCRRLWAYVRRRPFELIEEAIAGVHDKAAVYVERLAGPGSGLRVRRWDQLPAGERSLAGLRGKLEADGPLEVDDGDVGATWTDLRRIALGLIDGSELPDSVGADALLHGGRRLVVCDPDRIARHPDASPPAPAGAEGEDPSEDAGEEAAEDSSEEPAPMLAQIQAEVLMALDGARSRAEALGNAIAEAAARRAEDAKTAEPEPRRRRWLPWRGRRRRRRDPFVGLVRRVARYFIVACLATGGAMTQLSLLRGGVATALIWTLWFLFTANAARKAFWRARIADDERAARELRELNLTLARIQAQADAKRLERRAAELDTWIAVLAELVHRPWVREPFESLELDAGVAPESLPAACSAAVAEPDDVVLERIASRARAKAFRTGWLSSIYGSVEARAMADYNHVRDIGGPPRDPAADVTLDEDSPREALRLAVIGGHGRRLWENPIARELIEAVDATAIDELAPGVVGLASGARPLGPSTVWVVPPDGIGSVAAERAASAVAVGRHGAGVVVAPRTVLTATAVVSGRDVPSVVAVGGERITVVESIRLDRGLALLRCEADLPAESCSDAVAELRHGTAVVAWDARRGAESVRWGLVAGTAGTVAVAYEGASDPVAGTPLFDLDGRLVAIQGEGGGVAHRLDDVGELLAAAEESGPPPEGSEQDGEQQATRYDRPDNGGATPATGFLGAIFDAEGSRAMTPIHWTSGNGSNRIELSLPPGMVLDGDAARVDRLSGGAEFMRPLRVMAHRIELTEPAAPEDLVSCGDDRGPEPTAPAPA